MHLQNDWLAGVWFFVFASGLTVIVSFGALMSAISEHNDLGIFVYFSGYLYARSNIILNNILFTIDLLTV
jgi:hypothetical protein